MPRIVIITPKFGGQSCELDDGAFSLGRGAPNLLDIRDPSVSSVQCDLLVFGPEVIVRERGSKNGTFVDGVRVEHQRGVRHNQIIRVGAIELRVEIERPDWDGETAATVSDDLRAFEKNCERQAPVYTTLPVVFSPASDSPIGDDDRPITGKNA